MSLENLLSDIDRNQNELVELHRSLVQIPSVNTGFMPTGNETPVCEFVQKWLKDSSIESQILGIVPERGNIISLMPGTSGKAGLMFMSHTDVVPVENESKWEFPPFSASISGGRIYGRGASDCKALLASQMMAMRILKRNNINLRDSLILASGADEEHGGRYGFKWLAENHADLIDAPFAVNEGGGIPVDAAGNLAYLLGVGEKGRLQIEITVRGSSSHASVPWQGENALFTFSKVLSSIENYAPEKDVSGPIFDYLSNFAIEDKPTSENIDQIIQDVELTNPSLASILKASSRMTLTPTMVNGGIKSNSVPETINLTCDVRTLPNQDEDYVRNQLDNILNDIDGISYEIDYMAVPNSSEFNSELATQISHATSIVLANPEIQWIPALSTGFTDSRFTRPIGVLTYGFTGAHPQDDQSKNNVHGTDESVGIKSLVSGAKIMTALAYNMLVEN